MKIVYIGKYFDPYIGGVETVSQQLCEGMSSCGHEVTIISCHERLLTKDKYTKNNYEVIKLKNFGRALSVPLCFWSAGLINKLAPDIVHFHLPNPLPLFFLSQLNGVKVATYHASILNKGLAGKIYAPKYKNQLSNFDKIIVTSEKTKKEINFSKMNINPSKVVSIPLGVSLFDNQSMKKEPVDSSMKLVFSGRLVAYKGLKYLISAMNSIDAHLFIVGDGPLKKNLQTQLSKLKLENKVTFIEPMPREKLFNFVKNCDLFVLPSVSEAEAFGMSALEAMSLGVPIVTTDLCSGVSEINIHMETGVIVSPKSVESLVQGINSILSKKILCDLGLKARDRYFNYYTLNKMLESHHSLYEELITN